MERDCTDSDCLRPMGLLDAPGQSPPRFLWRFHRAHHSDMEIDVTTAARFHIGELIFSGISKGLMILFWGPSLWGLVTFDLLLNLASQFHHSNLGIPFRIQDGWKGSSSLRGMHRCHHALHPDCYDTNFSTILSCWDRIFGSYHWARETSELAADRTVETPGTGDHETQTFPDDTLVLSPTLT